eukprot:TCONS_00069640-protein
MLVAKRIRTAKQINDFEESGIVIKVKFDDGFISEKDSLSLKFTTTNNIDSVPKDASSKAFGQIEIPDGRLVPADELESGLNGFALYEGKFYMCTILNVRSGNKRKSDSVMTIPSKSKSPKTKKSKKDPEKVTGKDDENEEENDSVMSISSKKSNKSSPKTTKSKKAQEKKLTEKDDKNEEALRLEAELKQKKKEDLKLRLDMQTQEKLKAISQVTGPIATPTKNATIPMYVPGGSPLAMRHFQSGFQSMLSDTCGDCTLKEVKILKYEEEMRSLRNGLEITRQENIILHRKIEDMTKSIEAQNNIIHELQSRPPPNETNESTEVPDDFDESVTENGEDKHELVRSTKVFVNTETMTKAHLMPLAGDVIPYLLRRLFSLQRLAGASLLEPKEGSKRIKKNGLKPLPENILVAIRAFVISNKLRPKKVYLKKKKKSNDEGEVEVEEEEDKEIKTDKKGGKYI